MKMKKHGRSGSGQALIETALIMPLLLLIVLNAVNFGYFYLVALNLASATRTGGLYSMIGSATPAGTALPAATGAATTTTSYLIYQELANSLPSGANASVQVCSGSLGVSGSGTAQTSQCETCSSSSSCGTTPGTGSPAPDSDPEAPTFVLNRIDVSYSFSPVIPGTPFGLALLPLSACSSSNGTVTCTFHRFLSVRAMGS